MFIRCIEKDLVQQEQFSEMGSPVGYTDRERGRRDEPHGYAGSR